MTHTHAVVGAAGGLGAAIVRGLIANGQTVRAVVRNGDRAHHVLPAGVKIEVADAVDAKGIHKACRNATVIYHCVNVPFDKWATVLPKVSENILTCARDTGAVLLFPGNVYGYGPLKSAPAREDHPLAATSHKGQLRNQIERQLMDAHESGKVQVVIPRFPHFYGPNVTSRLTLPVFRAALSGVAASWPGELDVPHDFIYIDDAATACVLLARTRNAYGQTWHVPGAGPMTARQFVELVYRAAGTEPTLEPVRPDALNFSGGAMSEAAELAELMYLYEQSLVLDGRKFAKAFPEFRYTPHEQAIHRTIEWLTEHSVV